MNLDAFLAKLNATLERGHHNLRAQCAKSQQERVELLVSGGSAAAMQDLYLALKDPKVSRHLESWFHGDLLVTVIGAGWVKPVPAALIRGGAVFLVSGSQGAVETTTPSTSFARWFEELIGAPLPFPLELEPRGEDLWGCPKTRRRKTTGFPHTLRITKSTSYTLAGFAGYGSNSYAFYFTRVGGPTRMYLRLPWGGAYMHPEKERPRLLGGLQEANRLFDLAVAKKLPLFLHCDMGEWHVAAVPEPEGPEIASWPFLDNARRYIETGELKPDE